MYEKNSPHLIHVKTFRRYWNFHTHPSPTTTHFIACIVSVSHAIVKSRTLFTLNLYKKILYYNFWTNTGTQVKSISLHLYNLFTTTTLVETRWRYLFLPPSTISFSFDLFKYNIHFCFINKLCKWSLNIT